MARIDLDGLLDFIVDKAITELKGKIKELEDKLTDSYKERDRWLDEYITVHDNFKKLVEKNEELEKINKANAKSYEKFWYKLESYKQTLTEIKEIVKPHQRNIDKICGHCRRYDGCHAFCIDNNLYRQYKKPTTPACDKYCELKEFEINNISNQILEKISEVENG